MAVSDYDSLYESSGRQYNVDPQLIRAVVTSESSGNPDAISSAGAEGVAQLMPKTARSLGVSNAFDPKQAIPGAAKLLAENLDRYGSPEQAILAYHGGTDQANWGPKTHAYLASVTRNYGAPKGAEMAQAAPAPQDDAFSAAFGGAAQSSAPASANDAFSAAFSGSGVPSQGPAETVPPKESGLTASIKKLPLVSLAATAAPALQTLGGDISAAMRDRRNELVGDFTRPLDRQPSDLPQGGLSDRVTATAVPLRALKVVGDVGSALASPIEGVGRYLLGRPAEVMTGGEVPKEAIGNDISMLAQMAAGTLKLPEIGPVNRLAGAEEPAAQRVLNAPWGNRPLAISREGASAGVPQIIDQSAPGANALSPWGSGPAPVNELAAIPEKLPPKPLLPVITRSGAEKQADRIIAHFAGNGPLNVDTSQIVPGSTPTLAHATGNPGIATLERGFMDANPGPFAERMAANDAARTNLIQDTIGTPQDIEAAVVARDRQTSALRDAAFAPGNVDKADAAPVVAKIDEILASPSGQRDAVQSSLKNILAKIEIKDPETGAVTLQSDPQQLYGIRKAIGDALSPLSAGTASDGRQAARELGQVQDVLDKAIESGAPGFSKYIDAYSAASRPIDGMKYLQGLNLTDATGKITLAKVDSALKTIQKQQQVGGARAVKSVSDEQLANLMAIRDDLRRQANIYKGKSLGSTTFQNLATNAATGALGNPLVAHGTTLLGGMHPAIGIPLAGARYAGNKLANRGEAMVQQALQNRLLNP